MISSRVAGEMEGVLDIFTVGKTEYVTVECRGGCKVYELVSGYSQVSGGTMRRGPVVRRYDPEVWGKKEEGKPALFPSPVEAEAYCRRWLNHTPRGA